MKLDTSKPIASVSYNGVDIPFIVNATLLWENADPSSNFSAQTVTLPTGYSAYLVEFAHGVSKTTERGVGYLPFSTAEQVCGAAVVKASTGSVTCVGRRITSCSDGSITFYGTGYYNGSGGTAAWAIPTRIWGTTFTLD